MISDLFGEIIGTFVFILFILIQVGEKTTFTKNSIAGVGLISVALLFARQYTWHSGGCLNPAMGISLEIF
jgi:glycerol uptake facilitator-like aquaporin